jgi:hypothetical protein
VICAILPDEPSARNCQVAASSLLSVSDHPP